MGHAAGMPERSRTAGTTPTTPPAGDPASGGLRALVADLPGAVALDETTWRFSVWAPHARSLAVRLESGDRAGESLALEPQATDPAGSVGGIWTGTVAGLAHGDRYRLVLDGEALADPASRWQPDGVFGPSALVDPERLSRSSAPFRPPSLGRSVFSEQHVGCSTPQGTFAAMIGQLDRLEDLGVTTLELMPVAEFPGRRNWGYDGVFPYAAQSSYGGPEGLADLVTACHDRGLAVILDVVHNHFGPEGCVLARFGPYVTDRYRTPWGPAVNVEGWGADEVRRFLVGSVRWWLEALDVDGFRLDAIHGIVDPTARPYLAELADAVAEVGRRSGRERVLVAESADNNPRVLTPTDQLGYGMDGQWNDDFHHALHAVVTGERQGYYVDFGGLDQLARATAGGFVLDGRFSRFRGRHHGAPATGLAPWRFVCAAQNHDQIGNRPEADRLTTLVGPELAELACVLVALAPGTPLLFMGEEYGETRPFPFFVDLTDPELREAVRRGRAAELGVDPAELTPDPLDPATMAQAVLDPQVADRPPHDRRLALWRALLRLRRTHPALAPDAPARAEAIEGTLQLARQAGQAAILLLWRPEAGAAPIGLPAAGRRAQPWGVLAGSEEPIRPDLGDAPPLRWCAAGSTLQVPGPGWVLLERSGGDRP
jgi:maltooligosyltrehalose trehalohydrolase